MRRLKQQKGSATNHHDALITSATAKTGHKRTRRRRRPKHYHHHHNISKGGSVGSSTATASTAGLASYGTVTQQNPFGGVAGGIAVLSNKHHDAPMTRRDLYFALRCGIVNIGPLATDTAVGRVTLVNWENEIVLDTFVKIPVPITNYRTEVTGITPGLLERGASSLDSVRKKVGSLIRGKILIGHGLEVDLAALRLSHPWCDMRDTATYAPYMQQVLDPLTCMLLPRTLDDLLQNALDQSVPDDGQPVLVSEAIGCLSLYKAAREQWEGQIVQHMQQLERQRELVVNMRSSAAGAGEPNGPVLSRIAEDVSGDEHGAFFTERRLTELEEHDHYADRILMYATAATRGGEYGEYETSTLASELEATLENYEMYRDDVSETSSFVTNESELEECLRQQRPRNHLSDATTEAADLNPLFENLHLLNEFGRPPTMSNANGTFGSSTVAGSHVEEEWTVRGGGGGGSWGTSQHSGIWTPFPPSSTVNSVTTADWSLESPQAPVVRPISSVARRPRDIYPNSSKHRHMNHHPTFLAVSQTPPVTLNEEELREHLPAHLLDDLEGTVPLDNRLLFGRSKDEHDEPKKKSWFGLGRRRRSLSAPSSREAGFAELKAGAPRLSLSDRLPQRPKLESDDPQCDVGIGPTQSGQRYSNEDDLGVPPGF
eukprot:scaffold7586_cov174-Amphora_coffeaeformis.AAC.3